MTSRIDSRLPAAPGDHPEHGEGHAGHGEGHAGHGEGHGTVLEIFGLRSTILRAARLVLEAVVVPTVLLLVLLHVVGLMPSLAAAVGWCCLAAIFRWIFTREVPGALLMCVCMLTGRALVAIATSSIFIYVLQPALGSVLMAALFLGSAAFGRPITLRLARDFLVLPDHFVERHGVRRMFTQVALVWGVSRAIDAAMSIGFLQLSVDAGLLARGVISPVLSGLTIVISTFWGIRCLRRMGISLKLLPHHAAPGSKPAGPAVPVS